MIVIKHSNKWRYAKMSFYFEQLYYPCFKVPQCELFLRNLYSKISKIRAYKLVNCTKAEHEQIAKFNSFYQLSTHDVFRKIEQHACGCCYGGNSWTTKEQAEYIGQKLDLSSKSSLIDLGAGAGWPGLYLSSMSGCSLTLVDLPETG